MTRRLAGQDFLRLYGGAGVYPPRGVSLAGTASGFGRHLVVMVKAPIAGRVKTRLAQGIGSALATAFYRATIAAVIARVRRPRQWRTYLAVAPDIAAGAPVWPKGCSRLGQGGGDLGRRMQRVMDRMPPGPDRGRERSRFFTGIAEAMATQWGDWAMAEIERGVAA